MFPIELNEILSQYDLQLYITKVDYSTNILIIHFNLESDDINGKGEIFQSWTVEIEQVRKYKISLDYGEMISICDDHPLLWDYNDNQCELYYNGQCKDVPKLFYDLYYTYKLLYENYQSFPLYFGQDLNYILPFKFSNGLITSGSEKLMKLYGSTLEKNGLSYYLRVLKPPSFWDGKVFISETQKKVLFLGDSFIVGEKFIFKKC